MLINDLLLVTAATILFVIIFNVAFVLLTHVPDAPRTTLSGLTRIIRPVVFALAYLYGIAAIYAMTVAFVLGIPNNPLADRYPELAPDKVKAFMNQGIDGPFTFVLFPLILLITPAFLGGIWMIQIALRRLQRKTWDEPGDLISRLMRAWNVFWRYFGRPLAVLLLLASIFLIYGNQLVSAAIVLPTFVRDARYVQIPPKSLQALLVLTLIAGITLLFLIFTIVTNIIRGLRTLAWAAVDGDIQTAGIEEQLGRTRRGRIYTIYLFSASYEYSVSGSTYVGNRVALAAQNGSHTRAWLLSRRFKQGDRVIVYYQPDHPEKSVLVRGVPVYSLLIALLGVALTVVLPLLYFAALMDTPR